MFQYSTGTVQMESTIHILIFKITLRLDVGTVGVRRRGLWNRPLVELSLTRGGEARLLIALVRDVPVKRIDVRLLWTRGSKEYVNK